MLKKSDFNINCNLKSTELLAPDAQNYELSKFLILQTGDIQLRSGESKRLNLYFSQNNSIDKQNVEVEPLKKYLAGKNVGNEIISEKQISLGDDIKIDGKSSMIIEID